MWYLGGDSVLCVCGGVGKQSELIVATPFLLLFFPDHKNGSLAGGMRACLEGLQGKVKLK